MDSTLPKFEVPDELPLLPLREYVVFPSMVLPLFVGREPSVATVDDALAGERLVLLVAQRDPDVEEPTPDELHRVGTVGMVMRTLRLPDGRVKVLVQGLAKAEIEGFVEQEPALRARVRVLAPDPELEWSVETEALIRAVRARVEELLPLKNLPPEVLSVTSTVSDPGRLADLVVLSDDILVIPPERILSTKVLLTVLGGQDTYRSREF